MNGWTLNVDDHGIAWATIDLPDEKVNLFTTASMSGLESIADEIADRDDVKALVIRSGKAECFIAGADINELGSIETAEDARLKAVAGHWTFGKIAGLGVPTIAAIHGTCLGGGLELALACDYRLVTRHPSAKLGLPEVNLGIIPGWGGTQRLPRLIGLAPALKLILGGKPVDGRRARRLGLADGVINHRFLEEQTLAFIERLQRPAEVMKIRRRRRTSQRPMLRFMAAVTPLRWLIYRGARREVIRRTKGHYPAPLAVISVIARTYGRRSMEQGLEAERRAFADLACTSISRNLVSLFQASQRAKKSCASLSVRRRPAADTVAVVGAGIMGSGIAWAASRAGLSVRLKDVSWDALSRGMGSIAGTYRGYVKRRRMTDSEVALAMHRVAPTVDYSGFDRADIVIEAVIENLELKKRVLAEIEANVGDDTIICTNTSSLPLHELAEAMKNPRRLIGLHFFNPVPRMPLVEVIPGRRTLKRTLVGAADLVTRLGKTPIVVGDCPGFLVNRILLPYLIESAWMFEEGVDTKRIDEALERFGMPMGPLALVDEVGLDVGYEVAKELEHAYGQRMQVPSALGAVVESGELLGRKNGRGFYLYDNGHRRPNPAVAAMREQGRRTDGVEVRSLETEDIVDRAILIMVNEAARCLEEQVVEGPESLDVAMIMGTGFAPFRGGLLKYADERGMDEIRRRLEELAAVYGDRFRPAPLIEQLSDRHERFYRKSA